MKVSVALTLAAVGVFLPGGHTYPGGAPSSACTTMIPNHYGSSPSGANSPYYVSVSANNFNPGGQITVSLTSPCGQTFKGFMLQARRAGSNQTPALGSFSVPSGTKSITCGSGQAVTHTGRGEKSTLTFTWTAPSQSPGHVVFKATFVRQYSDFWTDVFSPVVMDNTLNSPVNPGPIVYPSPLACSTTKSVPPTTTPGRFPTTTWERLTTKVAEIPTGGACGQTMSCASDCENSGMCSVSVAWMYQPRFGNVLFTLTASVGSDNNRWMAIGLSDDSLMGNDSVAECTVYQGQFNVYSSFNSILWKSNERLADRQRGVTKVNASVVDGVFRCVFTRSVAANGVDFFDLFQDRHLLFAMGEIDRATGEKRMHVETPFRTDRRVSFFSAVKHRLFSGTMTSAADTWAIQGITFACLLSTAMLLAL